MNHRSRPTINEVAREAKVSISTVSRVFNLKHTGDLEVRERVLEVARKLNYQPDVAARELVSRRGGSIGFHYWDGGTDTETYYGEVLQGVEGEVRRHNYELHVSTSHHLQGVLDNGGTPKSLSGRDIQGVLCAGEMPDELHRAIRRQRLPIVYINTQYPHDPVDSVMCDNTAALYRVTRWLIKLGHRRIACIAAQASLKRFEPRQNVSVKERLVGYLQAMYEANLVDNVRVEEAPAFTIEDGYKAAEKLLSCNSPPTAVIGLTDELAVGTIQFARQAGIEVPRRLSIVGVNDLPIAQACNPSLTTVRIFSREMGQVAFQRLMEIIKDPDQGPRRIDLLCELVQRDSCAGVDGQPV
ncbi:MAG: LacI family DNA-binding transcriptional regulator [Candidatus Latescibacteria bacterium]|nr:LacI family DNA-binding transcriptional regulator [Candidatus Latescibacterota bacterium]